MYRNTPSKRRSELATISVVYADFESAVEFYGKSIENTENKKSSLLAVSLAASLAVSLAVYRTVSLAASPAVSVAASMAVSRITFDVPISGFQTTRVVSWNI